MQRSDNVLGSERRARTVELSNKLQPRSSGASYTSRNFKLLHRSQLLGTRRSFLASVPSGRRPPSPVRGDDDLGNAICAPPATRYDKSATISGLLSAVLLGTFRLGANTVDANGSSLFVVQDGPAGKSGAVFA